jgi:hypothetical protein
MDTTNHESEAPHFGPVATPVLPVSGRCMRCMELMRCTERSPAGQGLRVVLASGHDIKGSATCCKPGVNSCSRCQTQAARRHAEQQRVHTRGQQKRVLLQRVPATLLQPPGAAQGVQGIKGCGKGTGGYRQSSAGYHACAWDTLPWPANHAQLSLGRVHPRVSRTA